MVIVAMVTVAMVIIVQYRGIQGVWSQVIQWHVDVRVSLAVPLGRDPAEGGVSQQ